MKRTPSDGYRWQELATYNSECARGIVHTPEWDEAMAVEKAAFDAERDADWKARGYIQVGSNTWAPGDTP